MKSRSVEVSRGFAAAAARLAAHRAFIAAASCARRSGERLSFFFTFLAAPCPVGDADFGFFFWVDVEDLAARAPDFFFVLPAVVVVAPSLRFSSASFFEPSCKRASSRRIFFVSFLSFMSEQHSSDSPALSILTARPARNDLLIARSISALSQPRLPTHHPPRNRSNPCRARRRHNFRQFASD